MIEDHKMSLFTNTSFKFPLRPSFHAADYVTFTGFLCISSAIGIFFCFTSRRTTDEYFYGNRKVHPLLLGISTGISFFSANSILGYPSEMFINGYHHVIGTTSGCSGYFLGCILVVSLTYHLRATSLADYFAERFHSKFIRRSVCIILILTIFHYISECLMSSIVTLQTVTGGIIAIPIGLTISGVVAVFYTTVGGLKAVLWSDVFHIIVIIGSVSTIIITSVLNTRGGMTEVIRLSTHYKRVEALDWSLDASVRRSGWGLIIGMFVTWAIWCGQPVCVHRLNTARCRRDAFIVSGIASFVFLFCSLICELAGIHIFGYYASVGCDVHAAGWVHGNEILSYFVRDNLSYPGFQGLYVSALFCASLSSFSSGLNTATAILWKDVIKHIFSRNITPRNALMACRIIAVIFGILSTAWCFLLFLLGKFGYIVTSIQSSMYGAYMGAFLLSALFLNISKRSIIVSMLMSAAFTLWLGLGMMFYGPKTTVSLPTTVENCFIVVKRNETLSQSNVSKNGTSFFLSKFYSISPVWGHPLCLLVAVLVGLLVNGAIGPTIIDRVKRKKIARLTVFSTCIKCCDNHPSTENSEIDACVNSDVATEQERLNSDTGAEHETSLLNA